MATHPTTRSSTIFTAAILVAAVASVIVLFAIAPAAGDDADDGGNELQALITDVDPMAVDVFTHHAPDLERSDWCDVMAAHHDDWDGFRASIQAETIEWATDEVGLLAQVGVALAATCPGEVDAFVASAG